MKKSLITSKVLFLLFGVLLLVSCSLFDGQLNVIKKAEDIANNWDEGKFKEIYENPDNFDEVNDYKENNFGILRKVCEGKISFKIVDKNIISDDKTKVTIDMYCDGAVDFRKLGEGYENAVRQEAKKDNLIDNANVVLVKKEDKWLIDEFNW